MVSNVSCSDQGYFSLPKLHFEKKIDLKMIGVNENVNVALKSKWK